jgi:hypothetical protein
LRLCVQIKKSIKRKTLMSDNNSQPTIPTPTNPTPQEQSAIAAFFQKHVVKRAIALRDRFMTWVVANPNGRWALKLLGGMAVAGLTFVLGLVFLIWVGAFGNSTRFKKYSKPHRI